MSRTSATRLEADAAASRDKALRIAAGITGMVGSLALTIALVTSPERFGLSSSSALFERVRETGRGGEAFIVTWFLVAMPLSGLLQTPVAWLRRLRIRAGWVLLASQWLITVLLAAAAWSVEGLFPAADSPGKSDGLFGAALLVVLGTPLFAVCSGSVFPRESGADGLTVAERIRAQLAGTAVLVCGFGGACAGLLCGMSFGFPAAGAPAMFLPGGLLWGFCAGITLGTLISAALQRAPESRHATLTVAASFARLATALLAACLCTAQLGWFLPTGIMVPVGLVVPYLLLWLAGRYERLGHWVEWRTVEVPKGAFT
ncbi:hypothetical protein GCM10010377_54010 [Streptomyces viridiviolaceus]|uniref:DUF418 domain-containing protein n=1 Tax=Streptomyces viridiviolaceus TaxID=68282 RepID=A0ABW2E0L3_9ACTN|nr:hypothetical protein [Streptomyces viridiviolaceus]GHB56060.1 hypothetical protein GCM10010377_54010 [Streptomyces viridiviolaceus]